MLKTLRGAGDIALRFILYPTGEFSATKRRETGSLVPSNYAEGYETASAYLARSCACPGRPTAEFVSEVTSPLGLSNVPNYHKARKPRGRKGMSRYNKRLVTNSCLLLEREYGTKHLSFLTLTLPSECANREASLYAEAKRQFGQWLHRHLESLELPSHVIGCTELQMERYGKSGAVALHEHWVFVGRRPRSHWGITPRTLQSAWLKILSSVYRVDFPAASSSAAVRLESIRKSAASYLGKYMSKGAQVAEMLIQDGHSDCLPSSWVTRSISMLRLFQSSIVRFNIEDSRSIHDTLQDNFSIFVRWGRNLTIEMESGMRVWLGLCGFLNREGLKMIRLQYPRATLTGVLHCG